MLAQHYRTAFGTLSERNQRQPFNLKTQDTLMLHLAADPQAQQISTKAELSTDAGPTAGKGAQASFCLRGRQLARLQMDTLGIEPRASRMLSGCDTTTPRALAMRGILMSMRCSEHI